MGEEDLNYSWNGNLKEDDLEVYIIENSFCQW